MPVYELERIQKIPATLQEVWDFIATPRNLDKITPSYMGFHLTSSRLPEKMYAGMLIRYDIKPLLGITIHWITEITHLKEQEYFVDIQRRGPYGLWHHQHLFRPVAGGTEMTDIVHYQPPLGFLGRVVNGLFLQKQLNDVFAYRRVKIEEYFGKLP